MKTRAFTLIEIMTVVAIVGILSAVAYSSYRNSAAKSKWGEATICLAETVNKMESFRAGAGVYPTGSDPWGDIGMTNDCSDHYLGAISVTNDGANYIIGYWDSKSPIWGSGSAGDDIWIQTDTSEMIHLSDPVNGTSGTVPTGYSLPSKP